MTYDQMAAMYGFSPAVRAAGLLFWSGYFGSEPDGTA